MKTRQDILTILSGLLPDLRERYAVRSLSLFGSAARDEMTDTSDVDLLVEFESVPTLFEFAGLQFELADRLETSVDLVMRASLKPDIAVRALRDEVPVPT